MLTLPLVNYTVECVPLYINYCISHLVRHIYIYMGQRTADDGACARHVTHGRADNAVTY